MAPPLPRGDFAVTRRGAYLNHAGVAPLPRTAREAGDEANRAWAEEGGAAYRRYERRTEEVRAAAADLMGVPVEGVAIVKNTTEGLGFVASGLRWSPGDRVVVPSVEFPSTLYPFLALEDQGVEVVRLAPVGQGHTLPLELFDDELDRGPVRVVVVSWVQYARGWRIDLAELADVCHRHGALLCADVIQGLGVLPADLAAWNVDFAMADSHKWMLGPQGVGVLYVAPDHIDDLRVLEAGWNSVSHRDDFDRLELVYDPTARRFEGGTHNLTGIAQMGASIDLLLDRGVDRVWQHVAALTDDAVDRLAASGATILSDRSPAGRSAIVTFGVDGLDADDLWRACDAAGVICAPRGGGVRISPHGYNDETDIARLVDAVAGLAHSG